MDTGPPPCSPIASSPLGAGCSRPTARSSPSSTPSSSATHGLPLTSYEVLMYLGDAPDGKLRMGELADRLLLSRSGITRLVDRLARQGLLERERCEDDGRGYYALLTPLGRETLADRPARAPRGRPPALSRPPRSGRDRRPGAIWARLLGENEGSETWTKRLDFGRYAALMTIESDRPGKADHRPRAHRRAHRARDAEARRPHAAVQAALRARGQGDAQRRPLVVPGQQALAGLSRARAGRPRLGRRRRRVRRLPQRLRGDGGRPRQPDDRRGRQGPDRPRHPLRGPHRRLDRRRRRARATALACRSGASPTPAPSRRWTRSTSPAGSPAAT